MTPPAPAPLKLTLAQIAEWKIPQTELEPFIVERGEGFVRVDSSGDRWRGIVTKYIIPRTAEKTPPSPPPAPTEGPGTELQKLFSVLGINAMTECGCESKVESMNRLGVKGCRENRPMIIAWLRDGQRRYNWADRAIAAAKALKSGLFLKISWTDPLPDLVDLAIERAEKAECCTDGQCTCGPSSPAKSSAANSSA